MGRAAQMSCVTQIYICWEGEHEHNTDSLTLNIHPFILSWFWRITPTRRCNLVARDTWRCVRQRTWHQLRPNCEPSLQPSPLSRAMHPSSVTSRKRTLSTLSDETESVKKKVKNTNAVNDESHCQAVLDCGDTEESRYGICHISVQFPFSWPTVYCQCRQSGPKNYANSVQYATSNFSSSVNSLIMSLVPSKVPMIWYSTTVLSLWLQEIM